MGMAAVGLGGDSAETLYLPSLIVKSLNEKRLRWMVGLSPDVDGGVVSRFSRTRLIVAHWRTGACATIGLASGLEFARVCGWSCL